MDKPGVSEKNDNIYNVEFPVLRKSKHTGLVVSFRNPTTATVLISDNRYPVEYTNDTWTQYDNYDVWEELSNNPCEPNSDELEEMYQESIKDANNSIKTNISNGSNDGGKNNWYKFPDWVNDIDTLSEYLQLDGYEFNVLKSLTSNLGSRHSGTSIERELNKRLHYAKKSIEKLNRQKA